MWIESSFLIFYKTFTKFLWNNHILANLKLTNVCRDKDKFYFCEKHYFFYPYDSSSVKINLEKSFINLFDKRLHLFI